MKEVTIIIRLNVTDKFNTNDEDILTELCNDFTEELVLNSYLNNISAVWLDEILVTPNA